MNFLVEIRDTVDEILNPLVSKMLQNRKAVNILTIVIIIWSFGLSFFVSFEKILGSLAWALLLAILFITPIVKISRSKSLGSLMLFRREAGILMGVFAIEHTVLAFVKYSVPFSDIFNSSFWLASDGTFTYLGWGTLALIITIPLLITSNNFSMRILKINWKRLQHFAYLILVLVALHVAFIRYNYTTAFLIIIPFALLKFLAWRGFTLPQPQETKEHF